jgi:hypothetical protein
MWPRTVDSTQAGRCVSLVSNVALNTVVWFIADVNECSELNNRMSLCKNAKCINTEGSYKCLCLPGYIPSDKPNYCTPLNSALNLDKESDLE